MRHILAIAVLVVAIAVLVVGPAAAAAVAGTAAGPSGGPAAATLWLAQDDVPAIVAPRRVDTDQETVDFSGRVESRRRVRLSVEGMPVPVAADGSFRIRRTVPVGRSTLRLVARDTRGGQSELRVLVERSTQAAGTIEFGVYHALVIGNNDYRYLPDLKTAVADAFGVAAMLSERYGFAVTPLVNATRYEIVSALAEMRARLTERDNLLIYYAGHGSLDIDSDQGYWLPVDAERDNPANWLSNGTITDQLKAMRAKHVMIVADSCYSGRLTRDAGTKLATGGDRDPWLARMAQRRSRTALTSGGLEPVLDSGGGENSVFAQAFLRALAGNDGILDGATLFGMVKQPVVVNADQTPEYADIRRAGHDGGDFLFVPVGYTPTQAAAPAATTSPAPALATGGAAMELAFWKSIENSRSAGGFEAYLEQFPDGTFAPLARARVEELKRTQTAALTPPSAPLPPITPGSFVEHPEVADVIMRHYNEMRVVKYQGVSSVVEMVKVSKLRVLKIEGEIVTAEVKYRWRAVDYTFVEKSATGIATLERLGPTYRVLNFE